MSFFLTKSGFPEYLQLFTLKHARVVSSKKYFFQKLFSIFQIETKTFKNKRNTFTNRTFKFPFMGDR